MDQEEFEEVLANDDDREPIEDDDEADDEYIDDEEEKKAQYEILDENATMIFDRHQDAVFTARVAPNGQYIASGGQDDRGFVYKTDGELVMALFGHKESVVSVNWNKDSSLLASGDLSGLIKVWSINEKKCMIEFEEEEIEFVTFHPLHAKYLLAAQTDGNCYFYSCSDGNFKILPGGGVKVVAAEFLGDKGSELLVLYEDSTLRVFSIKTATMTANLSVQRQIGESICMDVSPDKSRILIGSSSGQLCVVSIDPGSYQLKLVDTIETDEEKAAGAKMDDDNDDEAHPIEVVKFWHNTSTTLGQLFVAGSLNGFVYVYENTGKLRLKLLHPDGVNGLIFAPGDVPRFVSACFDGRLRIWDCRNGQPLCELAGHKDHILDISREEMHMVTASDDNTVRYWDLNELSENKN